MDFLSNFFNINESLRLRFYFYRLLTCQIRELNSFYADYVEQNLKNYSACARCMPSVQLPPAASWADNPKFAFHGRHLNYLPGEFPLPPPTTRSPSFAHDLRQLCVSPMANSGIAEAGLARAGV